MLDLETQSHLENSVDLLARWHGNVKPAVF